MNRAERRATTRLRQRYLLVCSRCGRSFENESATLGQVQRDHYMRLHDTAKVCFNLLDRKTGAQRTLDG